MNKFQIDFRSLDDTFNKIPLSGNENKLVCVAFDLFRFKDGNPEELWQVQSSDDGQEYIVRAYALPEDEQEEIKISSSWKVELDKKGENFTVAFQDIPILKLSTKDYNLSPNDLQLFKRTIFNKFNHDNDFVNKVVTSLPITKREILKDAGLVLEKKSANKTKEYEDQAYEEDISCDYDYDDCKEEEDLQTMHLPSGDTVTMTRPLEHYFGNEEGQEELQNLEYKQDKDLDDWIGKIEDKKSRLFMLERYLEKKASKKTPEMEKFLDEISKKMFGGNRSENIKNKICVDCGKEAAEFDSPESAKEFEISGFCQECQNKLFGKD